jgi:sulfur carrier protein ThiS
MPSDTYSIWEHEIDDGVTVGKLFDQLAEKYQPIREKIFEMARNRFYPDVVVTLNNQMIYAHELYGRVLKEGDKLTVLSMLPGG